MTYPSKGDRVRVFRGNKLIDEGTVIGKPIIHGTTAIDVRSDDPSKYIRGYNTIRESEMNPTQRYGKEDTHFQPKGVRSMERMK